MCGIAGYSVGSESEAPRTLAAQALLAGIADRGADAVGYAYRGCGLAVTVHTQQTGASALLDDVSLPDETTEVLLHVRDYTKGHPTIAANNHPIRHGAVVGVHNGIIENDDELFARHGWARHEREMTVDSEVIFALAELGGDPARALEELHGTMAAAWIDEHRAGTLFLARGISRPLWIGRARGELFFASTRVTLELVERALRTRLRMAEMAEGRLVRVVAGEVVAEERWTPDPSFRETTVLPAVRAPHEGRTCMQRLAALAAWA